MKWRRDSIRTHTIAAEGQTVVQSEAMIGGDVTVESFYNDDFERLSCIAMMNAKDKYAEYEITVEEAGDVFGDDALCERQRTAEQLLQSSG